jgi:hypothetical protein
MSLLLARLAAAHRNAVVPYAALLHFDGSNGSTTITDQKSGHTWACTGLAALSTAHAVFGSSASLFTNVGHVLSTHADYSIGTADFTIEGWKLDPASSAAFGAMWDSRLGGAIGVAIYGNNATIANLSVYNTAGVLQVQCLNNTPDNTNFHHWFVCRKSGQLYCGFNGQLSSTQAAFAVTMAASPTITLGTAYDFSQPYKGYIDEVRMTIGKAYYAWTGASGSYTVPTAVFPN